MKVGRYGLLGISFVMGLLGCGGDTTGPTPGFGNQPFWTLSLNLYEINLARTSPYDTVRLIATSHTATGNVLTDTSQITYHAVDSTVTVDSGGLVTARYATPQTAVVVSRTIKGVTLTETAYIKIVDIAPTAPIATFSIQPLPGDLDSAKIAVDRSSDINNFSGNIPVYITNAMGDSICSNDLGCPLLVGYSTSNTSIASIGINGTLYTYTTGHVTLYATTFAYGVVKQDSLHFTVGYPEGIVVGAFAKNTSVGSEPLVVVFAAALDTIGVGGGVCMENHIQQFGARDSVIVLFDDTAAVTNGRIVLNQITYQGGGCARFVRFPSAGKYTFHTIPAGGTGIIVVSDGP